MSSVGKANAFISIAKENGWASTWSASEDREYVEVTATRGGEKVVVAWMSNQLNGPGTHTFHGISVGLSSALNAKRALQAARPDLEAFERRRKIATNKARVNNPSSEGSSTAESPLNMDDEHTLPFDIAQDSDGVILRAIRGNTLVWRNSMTNSLETEFVPHKTGDRVFNWDLKNVFYLAQSDSGRDYVSFMNINGVFRAVALEALVGVI